MKNNILATAVALSDRELLARIESLARSERETGAALVAHLAALELRPSLYVAQGYGSLFGYCRQALRLSEDAACTRIKAARACRRFPAIVDLLASGAVSLTAVRMLGPHLTVDNHEAVLARASHAALDDIKALVAELAPQPDVRASLRKLPVAGKPTDSTTAVPSSQTAPLLTLMEDGSGSDGATTVTDLRATPTHLSELPSPKNAPHADDGGLMKVGTAANGTAAPAVWVQSGVPPQRPVVETLAPGRYRLQCTVDEQTREKLRRLQALLRREIPDGDPAAIIDRAFDLLLEKVEKAKLGLVRKPAPPAAPRDASAAAYEKRIRFETDKSLARDEEYASRVPKGRHIPSGVKREVWRRDAGQCAFVAPGTSRRCSERTYLEFHHIHPYALDGPATVDNISLRCRRHNQYEGELIFGPRGHSKVSEARVCYEATSTASTEWTSIARIG
jgi:5-methylcytosine-specific restriction endonuclease McrA